MLSEFPHLILGLQGAAPTGDSCKNVIQAVPVKTTPLAINKAVSLGHTPFHQRVSFVTDTIWFIGSDSNVLDDVVAICQLRQGVSRTRSNYQSLERCAWAKRLGIRDGMYNFSAAKLLLKTTAAEPVSTGADIHFANFIAYLLLRYNTL